MVRAIANKHTIIAALKAYNVSSWSRVNFCYLETKKELGRFASTHDVGPNSADLTDTTA